MPQVRAVSAQNFTVSAEEDGQRLDVVLVGRFPALGRKTAADLSRDGLVRVNGRRSKKSHVVQKGDVIELNAMPAEREFSPTPNAVLPLTVIFEDSDFVVVDKAAGVPSHPLLASETQTVANSLVARYPEMVGFGYSAREAGLVHRLDTETSGLLLAARNETAFEALRDDLKAGRIDKQYIALVEGTVSGGRSIHYPLLPHPRDKKRVLVCVNERDQMNPAARSAETEVLDSKSVGDMSLLTVHAPVAGRHQVRAHLAAIGHPLAGDLLYGGPGIAGLSRHFLHASKLSFLHPRTRKPVEFSAALPQELQSVLDGLKTKA